MRSQPTPKGFFAVTAAGTAAAVAVCTFPCVARADTLSTFANFAPNISLNDAASFETPDLTGTGQLAFDPNDPDVLYAVNRVDPPNGGIYPYSVSARARLTNSAGNIFIGSADPMTWTSGTDPYSAVVGHDGSLYLSFYVGAGVYKVADPLSDAPTVTKLMGNYHNDPVAGDDDLSGIALMPANFGLTGYSANDLILFDNGVNANHQNAVVALHADGSDGDNPLVIWQRPTPAAAGAIHGAVDADSGYAYWISTVPEHNTIDGTDYASLYRINGSGVLQTIGLSLPAGITLNNADDPIAINPADGSLWLADNPGGEDRTMLRVDLANLTPSASDPNAFVAPVAPEFTATDFNMGVNSLTFNPDGTQLFAGTPNSADKIWVFDVTPDVTAPVHNPGDTNSDGVVDLADLNNVLNNFGSPGTLGDDNGNGTVELGDLNNVLNNFGTHYTVSAALSAVPEPVSLSLLTIGATSLLARRRRRA